MPVVLIVDITHYLYRRDIQGRERERERRGEEREKDGRREGGGGGE